ncbi:hypothetical protein OROGR_018061 [Orobanche gracilis]
MDRSWLWRRKSSEKSPNGESPAGSLSTTSSLPEIFSDDQALPNHNIRFPEVTYKGDELDDIVVKTSTTTTTLSERLSEALLNISAKENLVKQHAKVAEEAVSGWERAENEVLALKKQNDALIQKNASLNERVDLLDKALKECLRQLRQARDDQQDIIQDAIAKKGREWESNKSKLENQFSRTDTRSKFEEALEKENSVLQLNLLSITEELEQMTKERDLSTHAADNASKQHLDSIKRVAKLEAECRRLKSTANKARTVSHESLTDRQSENGELVDSDLCRTRGKRLFCPSIEIDLMDDFLEMERLVAIPGMHSSVRENYLQDELDAVVNRTRELEENLMKITAQNVTLENAPNKSEDQLNQTMAELVDMKMQLAVADNAKRDVEREVESTKVKLKKTSKLLNEAGSTTVQIQDELTRGNESMRRVEVELADAKVKRAEAEAQLKVRECELETSSSSIFALEKQVEKEKRFSREAVAKCDILEAEMLRMKSEDSQFQKSAIVEEFRINQEKELAVAATKFGECQKTIASLDRQLRSLATFEDFMIETERSDQ